MVTSDLLIDLSLLFLRIIIAIIFFSSGWSHFKKPIERGKSIGMSPSATSILGIAEMVGSVLLVVGIFTQIGATILMLAMLGAMYKKIFVWNIKFFADDGYGWHYDLLLFAGLLVIFALNGGNWVIV